MSHAQSMMELTFAFVLCLSSLILLVPNTGASPTQIHLSITEDASSVTVTWITFASISTPVVQYRLHSNSSDVMDMSATGTTSSFKDGLITRYVHRVILDHLKPLTKYDYRCGYNSEFSSVYTFRTLTNDPNYSPNFLVYGDFGYSNAQSLPRIKSEVDSGNIDAILHIGDMAYDLFEDEGRQGDNFMNMIQDVTTQLPYMTLPGNHENSQNFSDYKNRFSMPSRSSYENIFYSFNIGKAHIIMFSTEVYFFVDFGTAQIQTQYNWLENDLKQATTAEARAERPWIITMAHRPMYCSTTDNDDCDKKESIIRTGTSTSHSYPLEKLFHDYGVDMYVSAHEHIYERLWPVYDNQVMNGSYEAPYVNPKAMVHFVTGSAGCRERHDTFNKSQPDWVAFTSADYGYTRMKIYNATHIKIEQISDDQGGKIVDSFTLVKESHGQYE